jgi:hypothetical protein
MSAEAVTSPFLDELPEDVSRIGSVEALAAEIANQLHE